MLITNNRVTVVVPVYNMEQYIHQTMESVLNQTYENLEIILVDDGSTDNSVMICDGYAKADHRVRVIHKENGGLSSARKAGISAATGDYLIIVDSDDWIEPDTVEQCLHAATKHQTDCVLYSYVKEYPNKSIPVHLFDHEFHYAPSDAETRIIRRLIGPIKEELQSPQRAELLSSVCMKFYRMETVRKGRIVNEREVGSNEDGIFNLYALQGCSVSYIDRCFYHYRKTNVSSLTTRYNPDLPEKWDAMYRYLQEFVEGFAGDCDFTEAYLNRIACGMITLGLNEISAKKSLVSKARRIKEILCKDAYRIAFKRLDISFCPVYWKVFFVLCRFRAAFLLVILLFIMNYLRANVAA